MKREVVECPLKQDGINYKFDFENETDERILFNIGSYSGKSVSGAHIPMTLYAEYEPAPKTFVTSVPENSPC